MELNPIELANNQNPIENLTQQIRQSIKPDLNNKLDQIINSGYTGNNNLIGGVGIQPQNRKFSMEERIPITETHKLVGDEWLAKYPTYRLGADNAEIAAQNQSSLEQAYNGTLKALSNVGTTILGNTVGFVYGLADWASTGNFNATFDNSFSKTLDDWNTKLNYQLPNYYTKDAQNSGFFEQLVKNPTNTVFNDILNGVSFTVGTIASEALWSYVTGGASLLARAGQKGASIANIGKWGKIALGAETTAKGLASYKGFVNQAIVNAVRTGKIEMNTARVLATGAEALNTARFIATSSGNEAGIEAFHFKKEAEENFYNNFQQMYGRQPSTEEVTEFKKNVEDASTNVFLGNMAILGVSNMAMLGNMFGIKAPLKDFRKSFNKSLFGTGVEKIGETWSKINPTKFQKLNRALYVPTSSFVREGLFEEAGQGTVSKIANIWVERKYDPKYINKALDIWEVAQEAAYQQYGTKQGQKDIWIGGLVGMLGATFTGEFSEFKRQDEQAEKGEVKYLNTMDRLSTTLVEDITAGRITAVAQQLEAQDRAEKSLLKGDVIQAKLAHYDGLLTGIMMADKYDSSDNLINTLSTAIDASQDIEQEEKDLFKESLKDLHTTYKQAESFASSIIGGQGRVKGTLEGNTQDLKESLTYLLVQGNNANKLMQSTFDELKSYVKDDLLKAIELDTQFTNDKKETRKNLTKLTRSYNKINDNLELVKKQALELNARPNEIEGDKQSQIYQNQQKLIELENEKQNIKSEVEKIKNQLEQNGKFQSVLASATSTELNALGEFISVDDMLTLDDRLQELNTAYKTIKEINPVNAEVLSDLINQYNNAKTSLINYNSAANLIAKGDFKLRIANDTPFSKMLGLQKEDERTKTFYNELINIRNKEFLKLAEKNQLSDVEKIQEELNTLNEKTELTEEEEVRREELLKQQATLEDSVLLEVMNDTPSITGVELSKLQKELEDLQAQKRKINLDAKDNKESEILAKQYETIINKYVKINKPYSPKEAFEIIEHFGVDEQTRVIINQIKEKVLKSKVLIEFTDNYKQEKKETTTRGFYSLAHNTITINLFSLIEDGFNLNDVSRITTHEMIHAVTRRTTHLYKEDKNSLSEKEIKAVENLNNLLKDLNENPLVKDEYGITNIDELLAELSNKRFVDKLKSIPYKGKSFFEKLISYITNIVTNDSTYYDQVFNALVDITDEFSTPYYETFYFKKGVRDSNKKTLEEALNILKSKKDSDIKSKRGIPQKLKSLDNKIKDIKDKINKLNTPVSSKQLSLKSPLIQLEERVKNILKDFDVEFVGQENIEEKLKNKPDQKDIDRYRELQDSNETNTDEFKELQSKLSLWKVLDSLSDDNQESVADLLDKIQSLKQEVEEDQTDTEPIPVFDNESDLETNKSGKIDNFQLTQNTNFPPTLKVKNDGTIVLTHLKPKQLLNKFINIELLKGDVDNFKYGDKFVFKDNGITRNFTIGTGMSLEISKEDFLATPNIISSNNQTDKVTNWSYSVLYEVNTNGEVVPMTSGFYDSNITGTTNNLKEGDIIELEVDINNPYNLELKNNKDRKFVEEQLVIYVKKGGEVVQTLKGITGREIPQGQEAIISIRKQAYKQFITGKSGVIGTTTVERVEMGVPVLTLSENGIITTKPITKQGINNIVTTGYIQNGELFLSDEKISKEKIRKSYVSKNSRQNKDKKTPIVIIKQSKQLVAFPIKVVKSPNPQGDKVLEIFNSNQEDGKKIIQINNLLAENKISPETFELTSLEQTDVLSSIEDALNKVENFITADDLVNKYDKNNLVNDAEISLDLENLNTYLPSQKLLISFDNLELKEEALEKVAEKTKNKVLKNIKQDKQVAKVIVEDKEKLEELNKNRKIKDLNLQVGENTTVIDKKYPKNKEGEVKTEDILKTNLNISNPNIFIDYSELEKGALTNLYRKQDGKWYFLDSNKREQKEMQKNQEFLNWLLNNVGNNYTITSEKFKEKKEEYKTIQELNSTEKNIQCK